eukprot:3931251-Ditylum_brightwellii.AAC.1
MPQCVICSMEESVMHKNQRIKNNCSRGFARRKTHLVKRPMPHYPIIAHTCALLRIKQHAFENFL